MSTKKVILVIGATGQQGGAVTKQLLANGWKVRALVRDPKKQASQFLREQGVEIVQGDLNNVDSVREAMNEVYGVFSVQALHIEDPTAEVRYGKLLADCAKQLHVKHFVYSSAAGADRHMGITAFENKGEIERYIHSIQLPATIVRPVMFMDNFRFLLEQMNEQIDLPYMGTWETKVQMIAVYDIGVFVEKIFADPATYIGKAFEIAGDELTIRQMVEQLTESVSVPVVYPSSIPSGVHNQDGVKANQFFAKEGYQSDLQWLRQLHPTLLQFQTWLETLQRK